ncbi:aspartate-semialdehyde dehydrogenase [Paludibacterium purpuratum]|uniref:Aspartate-semialdehyde dehydrogenase n=1 Tax=Paludibacterium purpuratum TaxID=1144873 RepID=A0A4R7BAD3_9NEIS|nr:aspartate-semialdehyde dehydrogenase [Paludibacterium purpuratum]TDR81543.1 aspartate-semialdehyde dehydrogenase [Paludibacterium purpuratum]
MRYRIAIGGATGNVGTEMLAILAARAFPAAQVVALASARSVGQTVNYGDTRLVVGNLATHDFSQTDILFLSTGGENSRKVSPLAAAAGCVVIDNSSAFRLHAEVPLVVPEVNAPDLAHWRARCILPVANCSTIQLAVALAPLHREATIRRVVVATYQSVSGGGKRQIARLRQEIEHARVQDSTVSWPPGTVDDNTVPYAFNVIPHIDTFLDDGRTREEWKMEQELHKILDPSIRLSATCVRVPVMVGHAEAVNVEFVRGLDVESARRCLTHAPGIAVLDKPEPGGYATPLSSAGKDDVYVSRLRRDSTVPHGLNFWVVADNIRKGAALNAVQIAETLIARADFGAHVAARRNGELGTPADSPLSNRSFS